MGFIAGSDDYKLRLGGAYPGIGDRRFVRGGLTAVYAHGLTRVDVFKALKSRRCYGTTGERMLLRMYADGHMMGEEYTTEAPPEISVKVIGTTDLETVEVFRGLQKVYEYPPPASSAKPSGWIKITWGGASRRSPYAGVMWDGDVRVEQGSISSLDFMPLDRGDEDFHDVTGAGFHWHTFTCGDEDGVNAYWVRVVQSDGEMAWSSPIYVNRVS